MLKYGRKKLYILRFPQLVFVMTSPIELINILEKIIAGLNYITDPKTDLLFTP